MSYLPVVCLMGPTASGKTDVALHLHEHLDCNLISVDSALVYRGMDIGTAKPDAETLRRAPHRLVDIRDPEETYSAGDFVSDARREIAVSHASGRLPVLVGGTMLYFRALTQGLAALPAADRAVRREIDRAAAAGGWPSLHRKLAGIDPSAAARINENDSQRIQRALEVHELSGRPISWWHANAEAVTPAYRYIRIALLPGNRPELHQRIETRLDDMLRRGFLEELRTLMARPQLRADSPSMRAVGYRQFWSYLAGSIDRETARQQALAATRQLAKRQLTWLRSEEGISRFAALEVEIFAAITRFIGKQMDE